MTVLKQTPSATALVRILSLPLMVGLLAGCDYASKLPDAPSNLGGFNAASKPPSVTSNGELDRLPPPPADAFAKLKAPVEDRTAMAEAPKTVGGTGLNTAPRTLPTPTGAGAGEDVAFAPLEFEAIGSPPSSGAVTAGAEGAGFSAPPLDSAGMDAPTYQAFDAAPLDTFAVTGSAGEPELSAYDLARNDAPIYTAPAQEYAIAPPPPATSALSFQNSGSLAVQASPVTVRSARLPNGAVVNVHPVIGAPGTSSATLADAVAQSLGLPVDRATARAASVSFDLRAQSERSTNGTVGVVWRLYDATDKLVGVFNESDGASNWSLVDDSSLREMGRRVGIQVAADSDLRRSTLMTASNIPAYGETQSIVIGQTQRPMAQTYVIPQGGNLNTAPMPRVSPRTAPVQMVIAPVAPQPVAPQPVAPQPVAMQPIRSQPTPAPVRNLPAAPRVAALAPLQAAPPPTFDTLRPVNTSQPVAAPTVVASGPRPLIFRGVNGAPGDGDIALSREVGKLLMQSGARLSTTPEPGALFLMAQVSKTPGAQSDRIEIVWRVEDSTGESVGQVTQANDVPRGMLDNAWGEDAIYAAEGARDGIMELLQGVGALDS